MIDRSPRTGPASEALAGELRAGLSLAQLAAQRHAGAELRLAQLAAERHPEADLPAIPETYGASYGRRLSLAEPREAAGYPAVTHW